MIDGKNFFDQPVKNDKVTYDNNIKIATGQGDDYTTGCLSHYTYFKKCYKMIAIDLSKQQVNVKPSNSQLNKLKSAIKNENEVVLRLSPNIVGDNETNFPRKLSLNGRQVASLRKSFAIHASADIKLSKTQFQR